MKPSPNTWPDGTKEPKRILVCLHCGDPRDLCEDKGCGGPEIEEMQVYPASVVQELVGALQEIAAPNVCAYQLGDDDCLSLGAPERCPRCLAVETLDNFNTTTGGQDG